MIRRPPRSTLFPSRRSSDLTEPGDLPTAGQAGGQHRLLQRRSEEHTSELQSQSNLVCRLLLEKKKKSTMSIGVYTLILDSLSSVKSLYTFRSNHITHSRQLIRTMN